MNNIAIIISGISIFISAFTLGWNLGLWFYRREEIKSVRRGRKLREVLASGDPGKLEKFIEDGI